MKIVKVKAGFGNQMFQYAFAKTVEKVTGEEVKLDLSAYEKPNGDMGRKPLILNFNLSLPIASREEILRLCLFEHERHNFFPKCYQLKIFLERKLNKQFCYECNNGGCTLDDIKNNSFFDGYWQDCSMVDSIMPELDKDFSLVKEISNKSKEKLEHINRVNSVFLGVR